MVEGGGGWKKMKMRVFRLWRLLKGDDEGGFRFVG